VFEYGILVQVTAGDRSCNHEGPEFAGFFPVDVGLTLKMKAATALNLI
jgi:hypothetical protein